MLRKLVCCSVLCLLAVGFSGHLGSADAAGDQEPDSKTNESSKPEQRDGGVRLMRAKLAASQAILEGLVTENFEQIEKGAMRLQVISTLDEWRVSDDPLYSQYSAEFRRIAAGLKEQAQHRNTDRAALSFVELNLSCVRCHEFLRDGRTKDKPQPK